MDFCAELMNHDELKIKLMKTEMTWLYLCGTVLKNFRITQSLKPDGSGSAPAQPQLDL